jgi:hypothetical protein
VAEHPHSASELPLKTVTAPDGSQIHYPNLPNVGEKFQPPNPATGEPSGTPESWRERVMGAARSAMERAETYGHAAVQALVLDDWKALTDVRSTPLQRIEGAADLASWAIPEGKVAEIAGHALAKAAEVASERLAIAGMEHTAEHLTAAAAVSRKWSDLTPNERVAGQKPWQDSTIWNRALTDAERCGAFETADDAKALLGSAGKDKDWHHVVESQAEKQFGAERVHNVDNLGAIEKEPTHREISKAFQNNDPRFGLDADGNERSLRTFLKDKPWDKHVAVGEDQLRERGLDPDKLRAETRQRFEKRIELHDHLLGRSQEHATPQINTAGALTSSGNDGGAPNLAAVQAGIERLRADGKNLPDAESVQPWNGKSSHGSFVDLGDGMVAQHNGQGKYSFMDVQRDLAGVQPPIGQSVDLNVNGQVQLPHHAHGLSY